MDLIHFRNETKLFPSPFHVFYGWFVILETVFRNGYVAACTTALRSTTEENDFGGYVDGTYPSKVEQLKSTADWLKVL